MENAPTPSMEVLLEHSAAVDSMWRMAAREAASSFHRHIEREHLLIALFALEKTAALCAESDAQAVRNELEQVRRLYEVLGLEHESMAELLRKRLEKGDYEHARKIVHRSKSCKSIFYHADQLARIHGDTILRCIHVFGAILQDPGEHFPDVLKELEIDLDDLRQGVAGGFRKESGLKMQDAKPRVQTENEDLESTVVKSSAPLKDSCHLVRLKGEQQAEVWLLPADRPSLIGSSGGSKVRVDIDLWPDSKISECHARLWFSESSWWIEDLNSVHGTLLGGCQIEGKGASPLNPWKEIRMGDSILFLAPPHWHRLRTPDLIVDLEVCPVINLGVFHCSPRIVSRLVVSNQSDGRTAGQTLSISLAEFATAEETTLPLLEPAQSVELAVPKFCFDYDALESRVEKSLCLLSVRLGHSLLQGPPIGIWLLAANEWACGSAYQHQLSLAAFVLPNHPLVEQLVGAASMELPAEQEAGESIRAIYEHLSEKWELGYAFEPPAWGASSQKIRFPDQVLSNFTEKKGHGTCIDLALLIAACLEHLHHEPMIAVVDMGNTWHALVGCWRYQKGGLEPLLFEKDRVLTEAVWIDPNGCTRAPEFGWDFSQASSQADSILSSNPLVFALDVAAARIIGRVEPLPFSGQPELSKEVRAALAKAAEIARNLCQPVGTVHILLGLLTIEDGITREVLREIGIPANEAKERLTIGLNQVRGPDEEKLASTRHHDMVLSVARSLAKRAGSHIVLERFALEALILTPSSALDNALGSLGTDRDAPRELLRKLSCDSNTHPTVPSMFPAKF